ncbi:uncharacterized protein LOC128213072 [Mya arenaria]|uniref:uncharacterized protein LOC128213072 n=1 Tax=Mya arenaria TaxID=6604 RepID=UPI0022E4BDCF|nr:uncharacterized protein LOC128213072 [Mya arenaria]
MSCVHINTGFAAIELIQLFAAKKERYSLSKQFALSFVTDSVDKFIEIVMDQREARYWLNSSHQFKPSKMPTKQVGTPQKAVILGRMKPSATQPVMIQRQDSASSDVAQSPSPMSPSSLPSGFHFPSRQRSMSFNDDDSSKIFT